MALLGQGDPRWIVAEREDGQNVNSWHWTEKDIFPNVKQSLTSLMAGQSIFDTPAMKIKITELSTCDGDAAVYNRKGKVSFILDVKFIVTWEAVLYDGSGEEISKHKGKLEVDEVEQDTNIDKLPVSVTSDKENANLTQRLKDEGIKFIREKVKVLLEQIKEEWNVVKAPRTPMSGNTAPTLTPETKAAPPKSKPLSETISYTAAIEWYAPPRNIFEVLTNEQRCSALMRCPTKFDKTIGGEFSFLNGTITGTITALEENKKLGMKWRISNWATGVFSNVVIDFDSFEEGRTSMKLQHDNIPHGELSRVKAGWAHNFWEPMQMMMGYAYKWKQGNPKDEDE